MRPYAYNDNLYIYILILGIFTAAFDVQIEWLVVKGIADYADSTDSTSENWSPFASVMAASVVANILSDPVVFRGWSHYKGIILVKPGFFLLVILPRSS